MAVDARGSPSFRTHLHRDGVGVASLRRNRRQRRGRRRRQWRRCRQRILAASSQPTPQPCILSHRPAGAAPLRVHSTACVQRGCVGAPGHRCRLSASVAPRPAGDSGAGRLHRRGMPRRHRRRGDHVARARPGLQRRAPVASPGIQGRCPRGWPPEIPCGLFYRARHRLHPADGLSRARGTALLCRWWRDAPRPRHGADPLGLPQLRRRSVDDGAVAAP
mmetsp:Transcript_10017/g.24637  ORF Transcript_10017/g.24637 Transcript_10017/m.24637 type:complete len:219 (-) Transcript_10017:1732-2388(-)